MTDFEAYRQFLALKLHFTSEHYDYFKYNGKHNATVSSFETVSYTHLTLPTNREV